MIRKNNFSFFDELFTQIVIFDLNNNVVFSGNELKDIVENTNTACCLLTINNTEYNKKPVSINQILDFIKSDSTLRTFKTDGNSEEFILFPLDLKGSYHIILAQKSKIDKVIKIEYDLNERVKELQCLYNVSEELESDRPLKEIFESCIKHVQNALQSPDDTIVNFEIDNNYYGDTDWDPKTIDSIITSDIILDEKKRGKIRVYIKNNIGYLEEEQTMINEIAHKFERAIEAFEKTVNLEKQKKILLKKNDALLKLTEDCHSKRERLRTFFSAITDKIIIVVDADFNISMSNKETIGDSGKCYEKLFGRKQKCVNCPSMKTIEHTQDFTEDTQDGEKYFTLRSYPIFNQEGIVDHALEVCSDITAQREMEAQLLQSYKLASLGKLVAGVAHEINNPNTFILGNLKIIQESFDDIFPVLDEKYEKNKNLKIARLPYELFKDNLSTLVNDMINGANRTKKIVFDLRNFAKKDDGQLNEPVDLNYIINNNLTITRSHIKKHAQLEIDLLSGLPKFQGNPVKLEQVLLNLVINASESFESGEGTIKIKTAYDIASKEIILIVSDNGCGIDENVIKSIFDPFFTTKRNKGGTGLGLSITYGIIKEHGGRISVESKSGIGTTFTIRFPQNMVE